MKHSTSIYLFFAILVFSFAGFAQNNQGVDLSFTTEVKKNASLDFLGQALQPDGKIIVYAQLRVDGIAFENKIYRLNTDGSIEASFNCSACNFTVSNVLVQPDGKILVAGSQNGVGKLIRINPDGSLDNSFVAVFSPPSFTSGEVINVLDIQADGKIYILSKITSGLSIYRYINRLNSDGSRDNTFTVIGGYSQPSSYMNLKVLPDGRIFVFGDSLSGYLAQINADGSKNTSFESPALAYAGGDPRFPAAITDIASTSDGKIYIIGRFHTVNGVNRFHFTRLNSNGSLDLQYNPAIALNDPGEGILEILPGDKLLVASNSLVGRKIVRLNPDGSLDNTFNVPQNLTSVLNLIVDSAGKIYVFGALPVNGAVVQYFRLNADGSHDPSFNPVFELSGSVTELAVQTDGKIIIGGDYTKVNGIARKTISRVNADGTLDTSFNSGSGFDDFINDIAIQADGKILVGGNFNTYNGAARAALARLNSDGSLDMSFTPVIPDSQNINSIVVQPDGKILIGGTFQTVNSTSRTALARLNSDGSLDASFNAILGSATINSIFLQSDGKIVIGGSFTGVNGFNRSNLARLNSDGSLDASFTASISPVKSILQQPDGKFLILQDNTVRRVNNNGSTDNSFIPPVIGGGNQSALIEDFLLQSNGAIVIGGNFTSVNNIQRKNITRLKPNGELDILFLPGGTDRFVRTFAGQPDGKIVVGGDFSVIGNVSRSAIARLSNIPLSQATNFDFDGDGRADIAVFRSANGAWYQLLGTNYQFAAQQFGANGDLIVPADYDGDGKTDIAVFRPSGGNWYFLNSSSNSFSAASWGTTGDIPMPSDSDGDGKANLIVFRPSNFTWYRLSSNGQFSSVPFGTAGDKPLIGDFDGDGKSDPAVFRTSTGEWWYASSRNSGVQTRAYLWGLGNDIPVTADFDGDRITDGAVFRPSNGTWYILNSSNGQYLIVQFGLGTDKPVAADYDGDGKADIAVYRPSNGTWYLLRSTEGFAGVQFGISTDIPIPSAFVP